jgi:hypothetical protein
MQAAIVDQAATAVASIEAPTLQKTLCLKKKGRRKHHAQDGATVAIARSRQPLCAAHAHTKQMDCRSSFGSSTPQWWRGASALISTSRRNTGRNRRGGVQ